MRHNLNKIYLLFFFTTLLLTHSCSHNTSNKKKLEQVEKAFFQNKNNSHIAEGKQFAIASQGEATSRAALEMIQAGGNIIDAFAAASFVISVERPHSTGLGGGGFLLFHNAHDNKTYAFDFREKAPLASTRDMYLNKKNEVIAEKSTYGALATGVPGLVDGVIKIHQKFGKLTLDQVIAPAIDLAENGFEVYPELEKAIQHTSEKLKKDPQALSLFFDKNKNPLKSGDLLLQKNLAKALKTIAKQQEKSMYSSQGAIAQALVKHQKNLGGIITFKDLESYETKSREPISQKFLGHTLYSMPPPSSGGAHVVQILKLLEILAPNPKTPFDSKNIFQTAESMRHAFYDRSRFLGDSDFTQVPLTGLTSQEYLQKIAEKISQNSTATKSNEIRGLNPFEYERLNNESSETTHFSMIDAEGSAISSTQTVNGHFGAQIMIPGFGIFLNNEMDDFSSKPGALNLYGAVGSSANEIVPEKRPLSSMSPTLVLHNGQPILALGSPSGTRIINCVAQVLANRMYYKMSLSEAQSAPRFHHQYIPDVLQVEKSAFHDNVWNEELTEKLTQLEYKVENKELGCRIQAVERNLNSVKAVADPRGQGTAKAF